MGALFDILGILLACYVSYSLFTRSVYAKPGPWGRTLRRDEDAFAYWSAIVSYVLLSIALVFIF